MKREKVKTNYQFILYIGKKLESATVANGKGFANSLEEAKSMFESIRKETSNILKAEFYYENKLIKKV